ncbi:MAG: SDR family NAD(P)-dependent oxidoreductase [Chloroflexota bacterium]
MPDLRDSKISIVGASQGIGKALALELASRGAELFLLSRDERALAEVAAEAGRRGAKAHYAVCDATDLDRMKERAKEAAVAMGRIDIAVLNAGVAGSGFADEFSSAKVKKIFDVNVYGLAHGLEAYIPIMLAQGGGTIAGVSSLADSRGFPGSAAYSASKAAASHLLEATRVELRNRGVKVITIKPGFVRTNMTNKNDFTMPFLMEVDRAAKIIANGLERGKPRIYFPKMMTAISTLGRIIPGAIFDWALKDKKYSARKIDNPPS